MPLNWKPPVHMARWLIAGNLALIAALMLMTDLSLRSHRQAEEERARDIVDNLALSLSVEVGAELRLADNALATIAAQFHDAPSPEYRDLAVSRLLKEQRELLPQVAALRMTDAAGQVIAGLAPGEPAFSVAGRSYFNAAMASADMVISEPLQSRANGQWCIILARRLQNRDGQFAGLVYAVLSARHFVERFGHIALGPSGAVSLRSSALNLIARHSATEPASTKGFGARNVSDALVRSLAQNPERGSYLSRTALDNVERITAYRRLPGYPLLMFTGMSRDDVLATWRWQAGQQILLATLVAAAIAGASWLIHGVHRGERRAREAASRLAREQQAMLQNDLVGMLRVREGRVNWSNPALEWMFGYGSGELVGREARLLFISEPDYAELSAAGLAAIRAGRRYRTQLRMRRKNGSVFWVDVSGTMLSDTESLWMLVDIDALKQSEEVARGQALHDALTGLPNRRLFGERVEAAIQTARRTGEGFAICYLDLDGFKPINDRHGHAAGDTVLAEVGRRLQGLVRGNDVVARLGGDEFALLLSGVQRAADVEQLLQRGLGRLQARIALDDGTPVAVGASIGAVLGGGRDNGRDLMRAADEAMYAVKRSGKGRMRVLGGRHSELAATD